MKVIDDLLEFVYENRGEVTRFQIAGHFAFLGSEKLKLIEDFCIAYGLLIVDENNNLVMPREVIRFFNRLKELRK